MSIFPLSHISSTLQKHETIISILLLLIMHVLYLTSRTVTACYVSLYFLCTYLLF